jgi:hypothetical protein
MPEPPSANPSSPVQNADDLLTVISIAMLAFIVTDIAHEAFGHILGFYLAGGQSGLITTTRLIVWVKLGDPQWRLFDLGGPAGNLIFAFLAWLVQRFVRTRPLPLKLFLWLLMAFSLFWASGYLIFSGVLGRGDWMALLTGTRFLWPGRLLFVVLGIVLYRASIRLAASELRRIISVGETADRARLVRLIWVSYISAGVIACAGAIFDPWGPMEILNSGALSSFAGAVGLLYVPRNVFRLPQLPGVANNPISRDLPWLVAAAAGAIYYVGILGPGVLIWLGK